MLYSPIIHHHGSMLKVISCWRTAPADRQKSRLFTNIFHLSLSKEKLYVLFIPMKYILQDQSKDNVTTVSIN